MDHLHHINISITITITDHQAHLPLLLTDSLGNTLTLTAPILNYMVSIIIIIYMVSAINIYIITILLFVISIMLQVAAVSALVLLIFYAGGRDKLVEEELLLEENKVKHYFLVFLSLS